MRSLPAKAESARARRGSRSRARRGDGASDSHAGFSREEVRQQLQDELLAQITHGGRLCAEVERLLNQSPPPELETLIKLYRVMILKFSLEANVSPKIFQVVCDLMKPVMDWARLQEKQKERELAEQKYRDRVETQKSARAEGDVLTPDTLRKIESELKLF